MVSLWDDHEIIRAVIVVPQHSLFLYTPREIRGHRDNCSNERTPYRDDGTAQNAEKKQKRK